MNAYKSTRAMSSVHLLLLILHNYY